MDTLYYRKIAEIVRRDEQAPELRAAAERALSTPRDSKARIGRMDKRALKTWMRAWCDARAAKAGSRG
jgi:hypothetical protein